ncbi:MAG: hypothetical protein ABWY08_02255 [Comamonas sp.]
MRRLVVGDPALRSSSGLGTARTAVQTDILLQDVKSITFSIGSGSVCWQKSFCKPI